MPGHLKHRLLDLSLGEARNPNRAGFDAAAPIQEEHRTLSGKDCGAALSSAHFTAREMPLVVMEDSDGWLVMNLVGIQ